MVKSIAAVGADTLSFDFSSFLWIICISAEIKMGFLFGPHILGIRNLKLHSAFHEIWKLLNNNLI